MVSYLERVIQGVICWSEWETYASAHALAWGDDAWPTFSRVKTSGYSLARRIY